MPGPIIQLYASLSEGWTLTVPQVRPCKHHMVPALRQLEATSEGNFWGPLALLSGLKPVFCHFKASGFSTQPCSWATATAWYAAQARPGASQCACDAGSVWKLLHTSPQACCRQQQRLYGPACTESWKSTAAPSRQDTTRHTLQLHWPQRLGCVGTQALNGLWLQAAAAPVWACLHKGLEKHINSQEIDSSHHTALQATNICILDTTRAPYRHTHCSRPHSHDLVAGSGSASVGLPAQRAGEAQRDVHLRLRHSQPAQQLHGALPPVAAAVGRDAGACPRCRAQALNSNISSMPACEQLARCCSDYLQLRHS